MWYIELQGISSIGFILELLLSANLRGLNFEHDVSSFIWIDSFGGRDILHAQCLDGHAGWNGWKKVISICHHGTSLNF